MGNGREGEKKSIDIRLSQNRSIDAVVGMGYNSGHKASGLLREGREILLC
jgi:hypothetical protein